MKSQTFSAMKYTPEHLKLWQYPSNYMGAHWNDFLVFLGQHCDSDCLTRANFDAGLKAVRAVMSKDSVPLPVTDSKHLFREPTDESTVQTVRENHWAVGWVEWIAIHESDTAALQCADKIMDKLDDYPVVDENLWSEYEQTEAEKVWRDCYQPKERAEYVRKHRDQFEFQDFADMLNCIRGKYFAGYAGELLI